MKLKKILSLILSLTIIMTTIYFLPSYVSASNDDGAILLRDELVAWTVDNLDPNDEADVLLYKGANSEEDYYGVELNSYKGISYNKETNTLTFNNVKQITNAFFLFISNMGNLNINLIGTSALIQLQVKNTNITFTGNGTLNMNPAMNWTRFKGEEYEEIHTNEHILDRPVSCEEATIKIGSQATLNIENNSKDESTMEFTFSTAKTNEELNKEVLTYGNISSAPQWKEEEQKTEAWDEPEYVGVPYVKHIFPASKLMRRVDDNNISNYWIVSRVDYYLPTYLVSPLVLNSDGMWVEDYKHGLRYDNGQYYSITEEGTYSNTPTVGVSFEYYDVFNNMPTSLVNDGMVTAYLNKAYPEGKGMLYKKDGQEYVMYMSLKADYYNVAVTPSVPAIPTDAEYAYEMLYIKTKGNTKYLEHCENIIDSYSESNAKKVAKDKGYELQAIHHDEVITYVYYLKNNPVKFTNNVAHVHSYTSKVTKVSTCTSTGIRTYTCSCGNTKTEVIAKISHTYKKVITKATLNKNGKIEEKCSACGDIKSTKAIPYPKKIKLKVSSYIYDGNAKKPAVVVTDSKGKTIASSNYTIVYKDNKKVGTAKAIITFKGNYEGKKELVFTINPKGTSLGNVTSSKKEIKVNWSKQNKETTGYELQYSTNSGFKSNNKTVNVKKNSTTVATVKNLKAKNKYYLRIRTYKKINGKTYYSNWSKSKNVTTKK